MSPVPHLNLETAPAAAADTATAILRLQSQVLSCAHFDAAAGSLVAGLAAEGEFERVSFGLREGAVTRVCAVSDSPKHTAASPEMRELAAAMDEAMDQGVTVRTPAATAITLAHERVGRRGTAVCTVPMVVSGAPVGAVCFERKSPGLFDPGEVELLEHVVMLIGPVLHLMWRAELPWHRRLAQRLRAHARTVRTTPRLALALGAALAVLALLLLLPVDRHVAGRARIEGEVQRVLVAPTDGFIQTVRVRPGDRVKAGQVLAELADKDLQLEHRKWASQLAQFENAYAGAAARADRALVAINLAKASEARAALALVEARLARTQVGAPFDGVVIHRDLSQSTGAPVQQGEALLTVARTDSFRVIIEIDERDIGPIRVGQQGTLALSALPWDSLPLEVVRLTPVAAAVDGANVFEVEAKLLEHSADLRPGLRGVAKIVAGRQQLLIGWTRRVVDWARLWAWAWLGW